MQLRDLRDNWNEFGKRDPLWAILTDPAKQGNKWDLDEFFATGRREIEELLFYVQSLGLTLLSGRALDFGCGVGRLTQALADHFESATGIDIAASMIERARQYNRHEERCTYMLNESNDLHVFANNTFAFIYSNYTLQHMQPGYALAYVREFVRVLRPGGTVVFQLPSARYGKERIRAALPLQALRVYQRVRHGAATDSPVMETHVVSRERVERVLAASDARLVQVRHNPQHDRRWMSLLYYVTKPV